MAPDKNTIRIHYWTLTGSCHSVIVAGRSETTVVRYRCDAVVACLTACFCVAVCLPLCHTYFARRYVLCYCENFFCAIVIMWFGIWLNYFQFQMSSDVCVPTWTCILTVLMLCPFMCCVVLYIGTLRWLDCGLLGLLLWTFKCFILFIFPCILQ